MDSTQITAVGSGSAYTQAATAAKSTDADTDAKATEDTSKAGFSDTAHASFWQAPPNHPPAQDIWQAHR